MVHKNYGLTLFALFILLLPGYPSPGVIEPVNGKLRIRLRTGQVNETFVFNSSGSRFLIEIFPGFRAEIEKEKSVAFTLYKNRVAVKIEGERALLADSAVITPVSHEGRFNLSEPGRPGNSNLFSGSLMIYPDLEGLLLVNECQADDYIAGVVRAEGGPGRNPEYVKTQVLITRTYTFRYLGKHLSDGFNLCDGTHCQAYHGTTDDTMIINAVRQTSGLVITTPDSMLIISAFHSNCGGETAPSENVWLTSLPYLRSVSDPYCTSSRNSSWERRISADEWTSVLKSSGYDGPVNDPALFVFSQPSRMMNYNTGSFSMPLNVLRTSLDLRSSWFSVTVQDDSLFLRGRGYGHGVGLCQEGAMAMAAKGFNYEDIIKYYYPGVMIINTEHAKRPPEIKK